VTVECRDITIDFIKVGNRKRPVRDVTALSESIAEVGLISPVTVTPNWELVAGLHRLEACKRLGWTKIPAYIVPLEEELHVELAELDENLIRNELTALERSEHLARRKEIYEALHPEAKHGGARDQDPESGSCPSFVDDTSSKTNRSRSTIAEEVKIAESIVPDVKEAIRDTDVADAKTTLVALSRLEPEQQREVVARGKTEILKAVRQIKRRKTEERRQRRLTAGKLKPPTYHLIQEQTPAETAPQVHPGAATVEIPAVQWTNIRKLVAYLKEAKEIPAPVLDLVAALADLVEGIDERGGGAADPPAGDGPLPRPGPASASTSQGGAS
jgi:ParB family chromosome partitioning protein